MRARLQGCEAVKVNVQSTLDDKIRLWVSTLEMYLQVNLTPAEAEELRHALATEVQEIHIRQDRSTPQFKPTEEIARCSVPGCGAAFSGNPRLELTAEDILDTHMEYKHPTKM